MLRLMLVRCCPALIPVGLYLLWFWFKRAKARKSGLPLPHITDGPWLLTAALSVVFLTASLFAIPLLEGTNSGTHYQPKELIDGKLIPGKLD